MGPRKRKAPLSSGQVGQTSLPYAIDEELFNIKEQFPQHKDLIAGLETVEIMPNQEISNLNQLNAVSFDLPSQLWLVFNSNAKIHYEIQLQVSKKSVLEFGNYDKATASDLTNLELNSDFVQKCFSQLKYYRNFNEIITSKLLNYEPHIISDYLHSAQDPLTFDTLYKSSEKDSAAFIGNNMSLADAKTLLSDGIKNLAAGAKVMGSFRPTQFPFPNQVGKTPRGNLDLMPNLLPSFRDDVSHSLELIIDPHQNAVFTHKKRDTQRFRLVFTKLSLSVDYIRFKSFPYYVSPREIFNPSVDRIVFPNTTFMSRQIDLEEGKEVVFKSFPHVILPQKFLIIQTDGNLLSNEQQSKEFNDKSLFTYVESQISRIELTRYDQHFYVNPEKCDFALGDTYFKARNLMRQKANLFSGHRLNPTYTVEDAVKNIIPAFLMDLTVYGSDSRIYPIKADKNEDLQAPATLEFKINFNSTKSKSGILHIFFIYDNLNDDFSKTYLDLKNGNIFNSLLYNQA